MTHFSDRSGNTFGDDDKFDREIAELLDAENAKTELFEVDGEPKNSDTFRVVHTLALCGAVPEGLDVGSLDSVKILELCSSPNEEVRRFAFAVLDLESLLGWVEHLRGLDELGAHWIAAKDMDDPLVVYALYEIGELCTKATTKAERDVLIAAAIELCGQLPLYDDPVERDAQLDMLTEMANLSQETFDCKIDAWNNLLHELVNTIAAKCGHHDNNEDIANAILRKADVLNRQATEECSPGVARADMAYLKEINQILHKSHITEADIEHFVEDAQQKLKHLLDKQ